MGKYVVTGGSGFIGTNLVSKLINEGHEVLNLDIARPQNEQQFPYWRQVDILEFEKLKVLILLFNPDVIIHLAAVTDLDGTTLDYYRANFDGTKHIIDIANMLPSIKKVVYTSSMYVCKPGYVPLNYDDYKPHTLYGESKVKAELLVKESVNINHNWVLIRPTSIWGPWFNIPYIDFFNVVYQGKYFDFGNTCTKTYGYVDNSIYQIQTLIDAESSCCKTFYIGDFEPIQISEWANEISIAMGKGKIKRIPFSAIQLAALTGDVLAKLKIKFPMTSFRLSNMTTNNTFPLQDLFQISGPVPVSRQEGVRRTLNWLVNNKSYKIRPASVSSEAVSNTYPVSLTE
ncbi:NAD(P)-dependent oxidoreductase [Pontibacter sp. SGAir0037]|uniref:NAD-dependent epimerase/dehydratase family protein n=1 Tax=Pontibacter sp. SGAir0037 TaxID=2571030 RepID=UPI0010CCDC71|nr:NAD(P)-dependent oxidoreductase [Pontibacter sp. SGAir0037]QCR22593.1 NAD(P)-dependent oxidoreductase [Pontibacter sp. SGAir0037]